MTWSLFSKASLEKFVSYNMNYQIINVFDYLEIGSMTIAEYGTHLYALSNFFTSKISIELKGIKMFSKGLDGFYQ